MNTAVRITPKSWVDETPEVNCLGRAFSSSAMPQSLHSGGRSETLMLVEGQDPNTPVLITKYR